MRRWINRPRSSFCKMRYASISLQILLCDNTCDIHAIFMFFLVFCCCWKIETISLFNRYSKLMIKQRLCYTFYFYYPLANEVAKGYSNATVCPSVRPSVRPSVLPSFRNILVNTLESTFFNGFWPNLVHT
jgi:hypothetical protein